MALPGKPTRDVALGAAVLGRHAFSVDVSAIAPFFAIGNVAAIVVRSGFAYAAGLTRVGGAFQTCQPRLAIPTPARRSSLAGDDEIVGKLATVTVVLDVVERHLALAALREMDAVGVRANLAADRIARSGSAARRRRQEQRQKEPPPTAKVSKVSGAEGWECAAQYPDKGVARRGATGQTPADEPSLKYGGFRTTALAPRCRYDVTRATPPRRYAVQSAGRCDQLVL